MIPPSRRLGFFLLLMTVFAGCESEGIDQESSRLLRSKVGESCVVQFRRDALGTASPNPISPMTGNHNGAETVLRGVLKSVKGDWLILDVPVPDTMIDGKSVVRECWVPKASVLLLQWPDHPSF